MDYFFIQKNLNKDTPIPLYFQLKELLLQFINTQEGPVSLPTEKQLCDHFAISRSTVRQALQELVNEGVIERHKAKGSVSTPMKLEQHFLSVLESFNDEMQEKGLQPKTQVLDLSLIEPSKTIQQALEIPSDQQVVQLIRLRGTEEAPIVLVYTYLPASFKGIKNIINDDLIHNSLYKILQSKYHVAIDSTRRIIEIRSASEFEAKQLHIKTNDPVQYIETISKTKEGVPFEFSKAYYRGDLNKFVIEIRNKRL